MRRMVKTGIGITLATALMAVCCKKENGVDGSLKQTSQGSGSIPAGELEKELSSDMVKFRDAFINAKDQNEIASLIKQSTDNLTNGTYKDNDVKLVAAQLLPLLELRGVLWRLTPLVEPTAALHSAIVTTMMTIATSSRVFTPEASSDGSGTMAWQSLNRYFTYPYLIDGKKTPDAFQSVAAFQEFLYKNVAVRLGAAINVLETMKIPDGHPVVWDNALIYGRGSFDKDYDSKDRYVSLYEGDKKLILSGLYAMKFNITTFYQYNFDQYPQFLADLGRLVGVDIVASQAGGIFGGATSQIHGLSALDRAQTLCGSSYPNGGCNGKYGTLFTRRQELNVMAEAKAWLDKSIENLDSAWNDIKRRGGSSPQFQDYQLLDPAKLLPWTRITDANIKNIKLIVAGQPVRSAITGKLVQFNLPAFFSNPPQDLKAFMPTAFDSSPRRMTVDGVSNVRNYEYGISKTWNPNAYQQYFPALPGGAQQVANGKEVPGIMRDLAQTWGGWFVNGPLAAASMVF